MAEQSFRYDPIDFYNRVVQSGYPYPAPQPKPTTTQARSYWTPQRIGRYYHAVQALPVGASYPTWLNMPGLEAAYKYLSETRQTEWQNWEDSLDTDPALAEFVSTWAPPPIEAIPDWEQQQLEQEYNLQQQYQPGAVEPVGEWTKYGIDKATWDKLPEWKKWANRVFRTRAGQVAMGGFQTSIPTLIATKNLPAALGAQLFGSGLASVVALEQGRMERLGEAYQPSFWYKAANAVIGTFNFLYSQSQQVEALLARTGGAIFYPGHPDTLEDLYGSWEKFKAAYEAGEAYTALSVFETTGRPQDYYGINKMVAEMADRGEIELTPKQQQLREQWEEQRKQVRIVNLTGEDIFLPVPEDWSIYNELHDIQKALESGQIAPGQVRDYVFQKYGFSSELGDLLGGLVLDPLNVLPNIQTPAIRAVAKATGNVPLQKAFTDVPDVQQGLWKYRQIIRTEMTPDEIAKLSNLTRTFASVTKEGLPVELRQPGELKGLPKIVDKMFGLTPEARAIEIQHQFIQGLAMLLETERGNPDGIMRMLNTFTAMRPKDAVDAIQTGKIKVTVGGKLTEVDMPRWFLSAEGQSVPLMMKDLAGPIKDHYDAWRNTRPQAEWMQRIADGLEMDVYKLIAEVHEGRMTFDQIIKQLDELEAQGRQPAKLLKQSLAKVKDLNNHALKQMADLFTGKDGLPFGADQWTVHLWNILADGADNWAAKWFNIRPSGFATRLAQLNKQAMSLLLLGVNPTYLLNNALNNIVTMIWDGVLGSMSKRTRSAYMRRFGLSTKIHKAYNQAEIGEIEPGRVELLGAKDRGYEIGKGVRAAKRNRDLLQMSSDLLHKLDKYAVAATLSRKMERWSSEMATVKGIMEYMDRTWRAGVGYDRMPDDLRVVLDGVQPGLADRIETAIARGLNKQEIEAEIYNRLDVPALRDVLTPDEMATLDHFPGLVDEIDAGVRAAKTPEEVRAAFDNAIDKVNREISADLQRRVAAIVHRYAAKSQIEGLQGAFDLMDQLVPERHDFWMEHMRKMDAAAQEAAKLTGLERANAWRKALEQADAEWRNFQQLEGAKWLGIVEGLGFEKMSPEYGQMMDNLRDVHAMWSNFYDLRRQMMDDYWGFVETTDFTGMSKAEGEALRSAKWAEINDRLNETYADYVVTEDAYQVAMDADLTRMYGERMGEASRIQAVDWRRSQLLARRVMIEAQVMWRLGELPEVVTKALGNVLPKEIADKIRLLNNGEPIYKMPVGQRDAANQKFYRQIYQPLIGEMMQTAAIGQKPKPKAPKGEAPRAEERKPTEKPKVEKPTAKNPIEAEINRLMAEKKPEIKQVSETGAPDVDYRLNVIKWLLKFSPEARRTKVKYWADVTPALILDAWQNEQYFLKHQAELPGVEAPKDEGALETEAPKVEAAPETEAPRVEEAAPEAEPKPAPAQELSPENKWRRLVNESGKYNQIEKQFYTDAILPTESSRDVVLATIGRLLGELPEQNVKYIDTEGNYRVERGYGAERYWKEYDALAEKLKQLRADRVIRSSELRRAKKEARREALKSFDDAIRETKNEMARLHSDYKEALEWLRDSIKLGRLLNISRSDRVNEFRVGVMRKVIEDSIWPTETYIPPGTPEYELAYLSFMLDIGRYNQVVDILAEGGAFTTWDYADFERNGISRVQADYLVDLWLKKISEGNDAELRAVIVGEIEPTRGVPPEIQAEIERVRRANRAKERVIEQAQAMRQNADEILQLAPPKEVNGEIYREWLHNHYSSKYPDKPQRAAQRADFIWEVIDTAVETLAKETGLSKDEFYKNFVLSWGGEGMGGTTLYRADPERFYASLDRLEYERYDDGIHYALYSKEGLEQTADLTYLEAKELLGEEITAHILSEAVAGIIKGDILRTIPEGSFKVMPSEGVGALTYWTKTGQAIQHAFTRADAPDFLHEFVHAVTPILPEKYLRIIEEWYAETFGRTLPDGWYRKGAPDKDAFEKLSRAFEKAATEGFEGYTGKLRQVLDQIKQWMLEIYRRITHPDIDIPISDKLRDMFAHWLQLEKPKPEGETVTAPPAPEAPRPHAHEADALAKWIDRYRNWYSPEIKGAEVEYARNATPEMIAQDLDSVKTGAAVHNRGAASLLEYKKWIKRNNQTTWYDITRDGLAKLAELQGKKPITPPAPDIWKRRAEGGERTPAFEANPVIDIELQPRQTKSGKPITVAKLNKRVEYNVFKSMQETARKYGGWYDRNNSGFAFRSEQNARLFIDDIQGKQVEGAAQEVSEPSGKAPDMRAEQARRAKQAQKLFDAADKLEAIANESLGRDRLVNTRKRASQAAAATDAAYSDLALARTMRNIAQAIADGEADHLAKITAKTQIQELEYRLKQAMDARDRSSKDYSYSRAEGRPAELTDIQYAEPPSIKIHRSWLNDIAEAIRGKRGYKEKFNRLSRYVTEDYSTVSDPDVIAIFDELSKITPDLRHSRYGVESYNRLKNIGITTLEELKLALTEYMKVRSAKPKPDKIAELERSLVGMNIPGYFPTPKELAAELVADANIQPGMKVLEPSAGKGNIADAIKNAAPDADLDVVEYNTTLANILEEKGYKLIGNDIFDITGEYDRIVMNPPFERMADIDHVRKAYELLKPGGRLVSIMSASPFFRSDAKAVEFRNWLDTVGYAEPLPEGAFAKAERSTGVNTYKVIIDKPSSGREPDIQAPQTKGAVLYRKPTDPDGGDLPEPPVQGAPIGTGDELTGLPLEEITLEGWTKEVVPMLERARRAMLEMPKLGIDVAKDLPNEAQTRLRQYLGQVYSQLADTKIGAAKWGETRRQFALLDYTKQTGAEAATFSLLPYGFWYLHTALNWAARALNRPAIMANYFRLMRMQQRHTEGDGFPERLRYKTFIPMPFLPDWMGGGMWIDPYRQIFPFENITAPFRRASQEQNRENRRAEQILYDWVESGEISDEEAQAAIETREGPLWAKAHSQALTEIEQDFQNPFDYVFALTAPLLPINWAYNALTGRADRIGQLPFTRLVQTMTAAAGIGGPRGINLEAPIRRGLGLPEGDRLEDYWVDRELSNMVAEGLIDPDTAIIAMIDKTGEAFEEAQRRVSRQGVVKFFGAAIAADLMPEGEMIQRGLQQELAKAYDAKEAGDKDAVNRFYDKYPEYEARLAVFKDPQAKLRAFMISKIWDSYLNMPKAQKKVFREEAGDDFTELFLDEKTQSYNSITTDTLAMWAQSLVEKAGGTLPQTAGGAKMDVDWLADETAQAIQKYYDERDKLFGPYDPNEELDPKYSLWQNAYLAEHPAIIPYVIGEENKLQGLPLDIQTYVFRYRAERDARFPSIFDTQDKYFTLNKNERKAFLKQHPELPEYWDWRKQMAAAFPKAAAYILSEESLATEILDDDYVTYTSGGGGGYSGGGSGSPTYTSTGKPATGYHPPYLTSSELKLFSRALIMQLMAKFYRSEQLLPGAMLEVTRIWEQLGKPFGTLEDFIEFAVKPTLTQ